MVASNTLLGNPVRPVGILNFGGSYAFLVSVSEKIGNVPCPVNASVKISDYVTASDPAHPYVITSNTNAGQLFYQGIAGVPSLACPFTKNVEIAATNLESGLLMSWSFKLFVDNSILLRNYFGHLCRKVCCNWKRTTRSNILVSHTTSHPDPHPQRSTRRPKLLSDG